MLLNERTVRHRIQRGPDGLLKLYAGTSHGVEGVSCNVVRCFPWTAPDRYFSLRDHEGKELLLVKELTDLDPYSCEALQSALQEAGFLFEIEAIELIEEEFQLRVWKVRTQQGDRQFQTELETWPRRLPSGGVLIKDIAGDLYCVRDPRALDAGSYALLWPFIE